MDGAFHVGANDDDVLYPCEAMLANDVGGARDVVAGSCGSSGKVIDGPAIVLSGVTIEVGIQYVVGCNVGD